MFYLREESPVSRSFMFFFMSDGPVLWLVILVYFVVLLPGFKVWIERN